MSNPIELLFEKKYKDTIVLFSTRRDLIDALINTEGTIYKDADKTKLQVLISHLLNGRIRNVNEHLRYALTLVIKSRLKDHIDLDADKIATDIITSIENTNSEFQNLGNKILNDFLNDHNEAKYVAVFSSRPLELEPAPNNYLIKIRTERTKRILANLYNPTLIVKYRFNFPIETTCILFWRKLSYLLRKMIEKTSEEEQFNNYFSSLPEIINSLIDEEKTILKRLKIPFDTPQLLSLQDKIDLFLIYSDKKQWLQVVHLSEPVFIIPHIVFNPNNRLNCKGYLHFGYNEDSLELHKWASYDLQVWQDHVWNVLKARGNNKSKKYIDTIPNDRKDIVLDFK